MTRYRESYRLDNETLDIIATYMDDDIREQVHSELAPCAPEEFLRRYVELDEEILDTLDNEFGIELD